MSLWIVTIALAVPLEQPLPKSAMPEQPATLPMLSPYTSVDTQLSQNSLPSTQQPPQAEQKSLNSLPSESVTSSKTQNSATKQLTVPQRGSGSGKSTKIENFQPLAEDSTSAPRVNAMQQHDPNNQHEAAHADDLEEKVEAEYAPDELTKELAAKPPLFAAELSESNFPEIDFVFTWFNGNDRRTNRIREQALSKFDHSDLAADSQFARRYSDNDELRFALRSVEKHAPWVHKVLLVVGDGQPLPIWLNTNAPKLRIVRHSEFFPRDSKLPTFNSIAIESCLHRISGLSDYFVYFNDDMFLNKDVQPSMFVSRWGRPNVWLIDYKITGEVKLNDSGHDAAEKNTHRLIRSLVQYSHHDESVFDLQMLHQAKSLSRVMLGRAEHMVPQKFHKMRMAQFRTLSTISAISFAAHMCIHRGECEKAEPPVDVYSTIRLDGVAPTFARIRNENPIFFCINDGVPEMRVQVTTELQNVFPEKSQFEKGFK